jgi:hypothetical protein
MSARAGISADREATMTSNAHAQDVHNDLLDKIPAGAQFEHIGAGFGQAQYDGCHASIERGEVEYELGEAEPGRLCNIFQTKRVPHRRTTKVRAPRILKTLAS